MAFEPFTGRLNGETVRLDKFLLAPLVKDMQHGDVGYVNRGEYGGSYPARSKIPFVDINGLAVVYNELDVEAFAAEEGFPNLARLICVSRPRRRTPVDGYCIDDSAYPHRQHMPSRDRMQYIDWGDPLKLPLNVIAYVNSEFALERLGHRLKRDFKIEIGESALAAYRQEAM